MKFYVFESEEAAEAACTAGCPIYPTNTENTESEVGITTRLADWIKHPTLDKWLVRIKDFPQGEGNPIEEYDKTLIYDIIPIV